MVLHIVLYDLAAAHDDIRNHRKAREGKGQYALLSIDKDLRRVFRPAACQKQPSHIQNAWPGDPRLNIQADKGKAKPYQVEQSSALTKLGQIEENGEGDK